MGSDGQSMELSLPSETFVTLVSFRKNIIKIFLI